MEYLIRFTPQSIDELKDAMEYYNSKRDGLGDELYNAFYRQIVAVQTNPFAYSVRYEDVRFAVLKRFKSAIHFTIEPESNVVIVQGYFSFYRNNKLFWKKRL